MRERQEDSALVVCWFKLFFLPTQSANSTFADLCGPQEREVEMHERSSSENPFSRAVRSVNEARLSATSDARACRLPDAKTDAVRFLGSLRKDATRGAPERRVPRDVPRRCGEGPPHAELVRGPRGGSLRTRVPGSRPRAASLGRVPSVFRRPRREERRPGSYTRGGPRGPVSTPGGRASPPGTFECATLAPIPPDRASLRIARSCGPLAHS